MLSVDPYMVKFHPPSVRLVRERPTTVVRLIDLRGKKEEECTRMIAICKLYRSMENATQLNETPCSCGSVLLCGRSWCFGQSGVGSEAGYGLFSRIRQHHERYWKVRGGEDRKIYLEFLCRGGIVLAGIVGFPFLGGYRNPQISSCFSAVAFVVDSCCTRDSAGRHEPFCVRSSRSPRSQ